MDISISSSRPRDALSLPGRPKPYVMAHRGNRVVCPENTMASFRRALQDGADILETDLHLTADGVFACIHDGTVDRTTDGHGAVAEMTLQQLKGLSASYGRPEFAAERVPALSELTSILPQDVALALELKTDRFLEPDVCQQLAGQLAAAGVRERSVVLSFSLPRLRALRAAAPDIVDRTAVARAVPQPVVRMDRPPCRAGRGPARFNPRLSPVVLPPARLRRGAERRPWHNAQGSRSPLSRLCQVLDPPGIRAHPPARAYGE
jgi:hypothetical protein